LVIISEADAQRLITPALVAAAIRGALIAAADGEGQINPVVVGAGLRPGETFSLKSGAARGPQLVGVKIGSYWPSADAAGLPRHNSTTVLLNPADGRPLCILESGPLNEQRTAAADAIAASVLAREDAQTLAIVGAGRQAAAEVRAITSVRPIRTVLIVARSPERAAALRDRIVTFHAGAVEICGAEEACGRADILVTATSSRAPLFDAAWVRPGAHVASMGSDQLGKQELPPALFSRARLFCDLVDQSTRIGEFQHTQPAARGSITAIGDVLTGRASGRTSADEITVFDSSGLALQDLFIAKALYDANATR